MSMDTFAQAFIGRLQAGGFAAVRDDLHGSNLPPNWEQMIGPFFDSLQGKPLNGSPQPVAGMSRAELHWPEGSLPEPLDQVEHVIVVGYEIGTAGEDGHDKTEMSFPVLEVDGAWKVVLAG